MLILASCGGGGGQTSADNATLASTTVAAQTSAGSVGSGTSFAYGATNVSDPAAVPTGAVYYVATTGNDTDTGAADHPWKTIQHAANVVQAGDTVYVHAGVYNETVTVPTSGSASAGYITFRNVPGEAVVLDGSGLAVSGGVQGLFSLVSRSYVRVIGFELRNYSASGSDIPVGIFVSGAGNHIELRNNHVHHIATTTTPGNAYGIVIYGNQAPAGLTNVVIDGNEVDHLTTGSSESLALDGNVQYWQVTNNVVHDNNNIGIDAAGYFGTSPQTAYDQARNGLIAGNTVYNITSINNPAYGGSYGADGIYIDGGTQIVIERNRVYQTDLGIELASENYGKTTHQVIARNNLSYFNNLTGISLGGYASSVGGTSYVSVVGNTLFGNDTQRTGSGELQIQYHATSNLIENNVLYANSQGLLINHIDSTLTPGTLDYNLYYTATGASQSQWVWKNSSKTGFTAYKSASGRDAHSQFADPQFADLVAPDLHIAAFSPAVNAGNNLGSVLLGTVDFAGNPRLSTSLVSQGAYQP
ncbi:DUF1565 domain-containing protein [Andreprevotia chitinilytica]|uniref:DUF1565 domain-containing protein n=1 Tax=Andreprevotia chitinilytica TaxID=396808 RepID=UPI00068DDB15|nr:right-handed parallel beta-helix repeat-containing protein [Andreprevotia chitinilytica]